MKFFGARVWVNHHDSIFGSRLFRELQWSGESGIDNNTMYPNFSEGYLKVKLREKMPFIFLSFQGSTMNIPKI
jgi:hypothetical protein